MVICSRLIDVPIIPEIELKVSEIVNIGAPLLLPDLQDRIKLLHQQLPNYAQLSQGQKKLLDIVLSSLEEPNHIAALLNLDGSLEKSKEHLLATQMLMDTLLQSNNTHAVCSQFSHNCYFKIYAFHI